MFSPGVKKRNININYVPLTKFEWNFIMIFEKLFCKQIKDATWEHDYHAHMCLSVCLLTMVYMSAVSPC